MKRVLCPKCDELISINSKRIQELRESDKERMTLSCPKCAHQLRIRLRHHSEITKGDESGQHLSWGHIVVLENIFGYKQYFPLRKGLNHIGRRNKDTETDIPIITGDPSMDRHHCIIKAQLSKQGNQRWSLKDDDSHVGTFVAGGILGDGEWYDLHEGDVFTLGATSIIFYPHPIPGSEAHSQIEGETTH